jgi:hypothetical protein
MIRPFTLDDLANVVDSVQHRLDNGDDLQTSIGVVLFNYGDRFATATCIAGEWTGEKHELPRTSGIPLCPNRHPLTQTAGKTLALVDEEDLDR